MPRARVGDVIRINWESPGVRTCTEGIVNRLVVSLPSGAEYTLGHGRGHYTLYADDHEVEIMHEGQH